MRLSHRTGFTLLELSIVLVIIGLIVGGVLVGRDMITAAQLRSVISQVESYNTATNTFRTKYNCLPGDCSTASTYGLGPASGYGGDGTGNGIICADDTFPSTTGGEYLAFWVHLSAADLIEFLVPAAPPSPVYGTDGLPPLKITATNTNNMRAGLWVINGNLSRRSGPPGGQNYLPGDNNHWFWMAADLDGATGVAAITPLQAYQIDTKLDDGLPATGTVLGAGNTYVHVVSAGNSGKRPVVPTSGAGGSSAPFCMSTSTSPGTYNVQNESRGANLCSLLLKSTF